MKRVVDVLVIFSILVVIVGLAEFGALNMTGMTVEETESNGAPTYYITCDFERCPYGCNEFGACLMEGEKSEGTLSIPKYIPQAGCIDTDGGRDYDAAGAITGVAGCEEGCTDECIDELGFNYNLWERYCEDSRMMGTGYKCPNGCSEGKCI